MERLLADPKIILKISDENFGEALLIAIGEGNLQAVTLLTKNPERLQQYKQSAIEKAHQLQNDGLKRKILMSLELGL